MKPYTKSKASKKMRLGKFYVLVTAAAVICTLVSLYASAGEMKVLIKERSEIVLLAEEEAKKQISLSGQKHYYESDSYIEWVAREKLGLVKPNDVVFIDRNSK